MASLIDEYRRHAADQGRFAMKDDADASDESYGRLQAAFHSLVREGKRTELFRLYEDVDPWVQWWAAAHTLEVDDVRAIAKLEQLEHSGIPLVSSGARYTIQEWENGELRFSPP